MLLRCREVKILQSCLADSHITHLHTHTSQVLWVLLRCREVKILQSCLADSHITHTHTHTHTPILGQGTLLGRVVYTHTDPYPSNSCWKGWCVHTHTHTPYPRNSCWNGWCVHTHTHTHTHTPYPRNSCWNGWCTHTHTHTHPILGTVVETGGVHTHTHTHTHTPYPRNRAPYWGTLLGSVRILFATRTGMGTASLAEGPESAGTWRAKGPWHKNGEILEDVVKE